MHQISSVGCLMLHVLLASKHKGVIERSFAGTSVGSRPSSFAEAFSDVCTELMGSPISAVAHGWLSAILEDISEVSYL